VEVFVVTKNISDQCLMRIRPQLPLCQLLGNGAHYMSLLGQLSQVTKK